MIHQAKPFPRTQLLILCGAALLEVLRSMLLGDCYLGFGGSGCIGVLGNTDIGWSWGISALAALSAVVTTPIFIYKLIGWLMTR